MMGGTCAGVSQDLLETLAADLCRSLEEQIACTREGNLVQGERRGQAASRTVTRIVPLLREGLTLSRGSRASLMKLYGELMLVLQTQSNSTSNDLRQLRQFRKAVLAYRNRTD
jgi:hypothetical protein